MGLLHVTYVDAIREPKSPYYSKLTITFYDNRLSIVLQQRGDNNEKGAFYWKFRYSNSYIHYHYNRDIIHKFNMHTFAILPIIITCVLLMSNMCSVNSQWAILLNIKTRSIKGEQLIVVNTYLTSCEQQDNMCKRPEGGRVE